MLDASNPENTAAKTKPKSKAPTPQKTQRFWPENMAKLATINNNQQSPGESQDEQHGTKSKHDSTELVHTSTDTTHSLTSVHGIVPGSITGDGPGILTLSNVATITPAMTLSGVTLLPGNVSE